MDLVVYRDHPLLPIDAPKGVPRIIESGDNKEWHDKPPLNAITMVDAVVTLLYDMGREDWLAKFLDYEATPYFEITISPGKLPMTFNPVYCRRDKTSVIICFGSRKPGAEREHIYDVCTKYLLNTLTGVFYPSIACEGGIGWTSERIAERERMYAGWFAWRIFDDKRAENVVDIYLDYTGIKETEKEDLASWLTLAKEDRKTIRFEEDVCRQCTAPEATNRCSRCKKARYCSVGCQKKHWKRHRGLCPAGSRE